jgi:hypothetical protein
MGQGSSQPVPPGQKEPQSHFLHTTDPGGLEKLAEHLFGGAQVSGQ